jgi:glycosyltransferase involved in cell wall biosynthesis
MIIQNEEEVLDNCLRYAQPHVDNMVLIDGGSTDSTAEIAKRYTQNIYTYKFENHFANQRNKLLNYIQQGWGLWLDADEILCLNPVSNTLRKLTKFLDENGYDSASFNRINSHNDSIETLDRHTRLFRLENVHWEGKISEGLVGLKNTYPTDYSLLHAKTWDRQKKQNNFYYKIAPEFYNEPPDGVK